MKKQINKPVRKIPSPEELMAKADAVADGFNLGDYRSVMFKLRHKGMTFRAIAAWLSEELGRPITHTQVFRMMQVNEEPPSGAEQDEALASELRAEDELESGRDQS